MNLKQRPQRYIEKRCGNNNKKKTTKKSQNVNKKKKTLPSCHLIPITSSNISIAISCGFYCFKYFAFQQSIFSRLRLKPRIEFFEREQYSKSFANLLDSLFGIVPKILGSMLKAALHFIDVPMRQTVTNLLQRIVMLIVVMLIVTIR